MLPTYTGTNHACNSPSLPAEPHDGLGHVPLAMGCVARPRPHHTARKCGITADLVRLGVSVPVSVLARCVLIIYSAQMAKKGRCKADSSARGLCPRAKHHARARGEGTGWGAKNNARPHAKDWARPHLGDQPTTLRIAVALCRLSQGGPQALPCRISTAITSHACRTDPCLEILHILLYTCS